jgi:hypothetical protein
MTDQRKEAQAQHLLLLIESAQRAGRSEREIEKLATTPFARMTTSSARRSRRTAAAPVQSTGLPPVTGYSPPDM